MPNARYTAANSGTTLPLASGSNEVGKTPPAKASARGGACLNVLEALWYRAAAVGKECRAFSMFVITRSWFDSTVICLILANCVFLALDDPTEEVSG